MRASSKGCQCGKPNKNNQFYIYNEREKRVKSDN